MPKKNTSKTWSELAPMFDRAREKKGLTYGQLGALTGLHPGRLKQYLTGYQFAFNPSANTMLRIMDALDYTIVLYMNPNINTKKPE